MKLDRYNLLILFILILACALYRVWDSRPMGFAPQIAMALFAGSICKDKRFAFLFPVLSLFNKNKIGQIFIGSLAGAVYFFLISNFMVWVGGGWDINNQPYPRSFSGLMLCYTEALPFFKWSVLSTLVFNGIFFGSFYLLGKSVLKKEMQTA